MALHIATPSDIDLTDERVTLELRDENGLRAATVVIACGIDGTSRDAVKVSIGTIPGDAALVTEFRVVQGG